MGKRYKENRKIPRHESAVRKAFYRYYPKLTCGALVNEGIELYLWAGISTYGIVSGGYPTKIYVNVHRIPKENISEAPIPIERTFRYRGRDIPLEFRVSNFAEVKKEKKEDRLPESDIEVKPEMPPPRKYNWY